MPVTKNGRFIGAIEFFTDISDLRTTFISRLRVSLTVLNGIALLALGTVSFATYRTNRFQVRALHKQSAKERDLMEDQLRLAREVRLLGELNEWLQSAVSGRVVRYGLTLHDPYSARSGGERLRLFETRAMCWMAAPVGMVAPTRRIFTPRGLGPASRRTYEYGASEIDFVCEHAEPHDGRPYFCFPFWHMAKQLACSICGRRGLGRGVSFQQETGAALCRADQHGDCQCADARSVARPIRSRPTDPGCSTVDT